MSFNNNNEQLNPGLCIPRVFNNISREKICAIFKSLHIGSIQRMDTIPCGNFNRVFIYLKWNDGLVASKARQRILEGKDIKVFYNEPWFWKISAIRSKS